MVFKARPGLDVFFQFTFFLDWAFLTREFSFIFCLQMDMRSNASYLIYLAVWAQELLYTLRFGVTRQEFPSSPNSKEGCLLTLLFIRACLERGDSPKNRPCASNTIFNLGLSVPDMEGISTLQMAINLISLQSFCTINNLCVFTHYCVFPFIQASRYFTVPYLWGRVYPAAVNDQRTLTYRWTI